MPAAETVEILNVKLGAALTTLRQVNFMYAEGVSGVHRGVHRLCRWMPLGIIPLSLMWSGVMMFAHAAEPFRLIVIFALGLLGLLGGASGLFVLRSLLDGFHCPDRILAEIAQTPNLAYHPNSVLRRAVARRGHATLGEFRTWVGNQQEILNNRANDFSASIEALRKGPPNCQIESLLPGARAFLEG